MFMRFLWGVAIGHTYTWKDQQEGSSYYARLEGLVKSSFDSAAQPTATSPAQASTSSSSARVGVLAPVFSWTDTGVREGHPLVPDGYAHSTNPVHDDGWEDDYDDLGGGHEEDQDEWDFRDDAEVITYDDMYKDWYLYSD
jgi:hypothetical protein